MYYDTERPLILDFKALCRKVIARTEEEVTAVEQVLNEFFTETEAGWFHRRCDTEIQKYQQNVQSKSAAGRASAAKRATKAVPSLVQPNNGSTDVQQPLNGCATNQEPLTRNQEKHKTFPPGAAKASPPPHSAKASRGSRLPDDWVLPAPWGDWAMKERPELTKQEVLAMADEFKDYWIAIPGVRGTKRDWYATWRNKVRHTKRAQQSGQKRFDPFAYVNRNFRRPTDAFEH